MSRNKSLSKRAQKLVKVELFDKPLLLPGKST